MTHMLWSAAAVRLTQKAQHMGRKALGTVYTTADGMASIRIQLDAATRIAFPLGRGGGDPAVPILVTLINTYARRLWLYRDGKWTPDTLKAELADACAKLAAVDSATVVKRWQDIVAMDAVKPVVRLSSVPTFAELAELWLTGELARRYGSVTMRENAHELFGQLKLWAFPVIGHMPIDTIDRHHLAEMRRRCKAGHSAAGMKRPLRDSSVAKVWQACYQIIGFGVDPLEVMTSHPIPLKSKPRVLDGRDRASLEPEDDDLLMSSPYVTIHNRIMWGVCAREGLRIGEALILPIGALRDFGNDKYVLRAYKPKSHRYTHRWASWVLDPGNGLGLMRYIERHRHGARAEDPIFVPERVLRFADKRTGKMKVSGAAEHFRADLRRAGVHHQHPELFVRGTEAGSRDHVREHELRALCVTMALAAERSDGYIRERTGHRDARTIEVYKRHVTELQARGRLTLTPLADAIPELWDMPKVTPTTVIRFWPASKIAE